MKTTLMFAGAMLATVALVGNAQTAPAKWPDTLSREIDRAYLSGDLVKVRAASALADRVAAAFPNDGLILHYQAFALYREASVMTGVGENAGKVLDRASGLLERSAKLRPLAETYSLMSSVDGLLIAQNPSRAMELGVEAGQVQGQAFGMAPTNPRVWLIRGMGSMYTPPEYGGGLKQAEDQIRKAIELFKTDAPKPGEPSWGKAEAHVWLGQVYEQMNQKDKAAAEYKAALEIEPNFAWARTLLASK